MLKKNYPIMRGYIAALQSIRKLPLGFKNRPGITIWRSVEEYKEGLLKMMWGLGNVNSAERLSEQIMFSSLKLPCVGGEQLNRK